MFGWSRPFRFSIKMANRGYQGWEWKISTWKNWQCFPWLQRRSSSAKCSPTIRSRMYTFRTFLSEFLGNYIWTLSKWNCNNDWSNILFNSDSSFASLEILLTVSYYLVLVGFGSGFTGLAYIYLTDIFYGSGKLCQHANRFDFRLKAWT